MSEEPEGVETGLVAYVEAIEAHMRRYRGAECVLSPRDFALARLWHRAQVPLAVVLVGIDRAFETEPGVSSLAYCRRRVEELAAPCPGPSATAAPRGEGLPLPELAEILGALRERLAELPRAGFALPLRKIEELQNLVAVAARPNWEYLRAKLREIDDEVSEAAVQALPSREADEVRAEATRAAERHRGRVDPPSLEDALGRLMRQRARERLRLPRVSVL